MNTRRQFPPTAPIAASCGMENFMRHLKARLLAIILIVVFVGLTYYGWHQLTAEGRHSLKLAAFAPLGLVRRLFPLILPTQAGKPVTTGDQILVLIVFPVGLGVRRSHSDL